VGVRLLLEPLHPALLHLSVLTSLREACRIAQRYHDVGVVLDTWHLWTEPDLVDTARKHADRIDVVHLADWRPGPYTERRALPGTGVMGLAALAGALREVLAHAWWELEVIDGDVGPSAQRQLLRDAVAAARDCGLYRQEEPCASPSSAARPAARAH
jgi:sugar phosphate isomerase/epimerase